MGIVYMIRRKDNGKTYVGKTVQDRLEGSRGRYPKGWNVDSCNAELRQDAVTLGKDKFEVMTEIIDACDEELHKREELLKEQLQAQGVQLYNGTKTSSVMGRKTGQRQRYKAFIRERLYARFGFVNEDWLELWTKTSYSTNRDGHSKGNNAKDSKVKFDVLIGGRDRPQNFEHVRLKIIAVIEELDLVIDQLGYAKTSMNWLKPNLKKCSDEIAHLIAMNLWKPEGKA